MITFANEAKSLWRKLKSEIKFYQVTQLLLSKSGFPLHFYSFIVFWFYFINDKKYFFTPDGTIAAW